MHLAASCVFRWNLAPCLCTTHVDVLWNTMDPSGAPSFYDDIARAIDIGDVNLLNAAIESHSQSRERDDVLADALFVACEKGRHEIVHHLLVQERAKPDLPSKSKQSKGYPPLIVAVLFFQKGPESAASNHAERTRSIVSLLKCGASLTACGPNGRNVFSHITSGDITELLLAARSGSELQEALALKDDDSGNDALMSAIVRECDETVSMSLIAHGANIHTVDNDHRTTLMKASWKRRINVVERLLQDKDIAKMKDKRGRNIWHHVAQDDDWEEKLINLFLTIDETNASVNDTDAIGRTPLHVCSIFGNVTIAKTLLDNKKAIVDAAESDENKTALHFAAAYGNTDTIKLLIDHDAERSATCHGNLKPLHLACGCDTDNVEAVKVLLDKDAGPQLKALTEDNMTPLHIAAAHGNIRIVKTLLEPPLFPNVNAQSQGGWTALHLACGRRGANRSPSDPTRADAQEQNYTDVVKELLEAGSEVNQKSQTSRTALHLAAEFGHAEIVELLLARKDVQFAAKDSSGNTPLLDAAKSEQRDTILQLLAPWSDRSIEALPEDVKRSAWEFDANVIDFKKTPGARPRRHKVSVFDLLYTPFSEPGAISRRHVSTKPDVENKGGFRWIHLPANNLHWCHTLLTKHFIERGFADVDGFKDLERSLGQLEYRGRKTRSQFMRPTYLAPSRPPGAPGRILTDPGFGAANGVPRPPVRSNSVEVAALDFAPPYPEAYTSPRDRDLDGFRRHFDPDPPNRWRIRVQRPTSHASIGQTVEGSAIGDHFASASPTDRDLSSFQKFDLDSPKYGGIQRPKPARLPSRTSISQTVEGSARGDHLASDMTMKPQKDSVSTPDDSFGTFLFMPYLARESRISVRAMHDCLPSKVRNATGKHVRPSEGQSRDIRLHQAYSRWKANDYGLHARRTLDQFLYPNVDTRQRDDDQVLLRYQRKDKSDFDGLVDAAMSDESAQDFDILMVDQLWLLVFGPELIVTSFPQKWRQPRMELPDLLGRILEELGPRTGTPAQNVSELAVCIVSQCISACDHTPRQSGKASVLDMFSSSVGDARLEEVKLFRRFRMASAAASRWVKYLVEDLDKNKKQIRDLEIIYHQDRHRAEGQPGHSESTGIQGRKTIDEPSFVEDLLSIYEETKLIEEVKDIRDELGILLQVNADQHLVHEQMAGAFGLGLSNYQQNTDNVLREQHYSLNQTKIKINNMMKQIDSIYESIVDLLDHKQKHSNTIEARYGSGYARSQAAETAKVGRTLMIFTVVTIIFLPMSFLAAFFAINIKELPHVDNEQQMSLSFIMRNVVGVGLGTALVFVIVAWHHHRALDWMRHIRLLTKNFASISARESRQESSRGIKKRP
jgi:ankyrin repeat protein/Mg2+ and Co2+ transporter CorA